MSAYLNLDAIHQDLGKIHEDLQQFQQTVDSLQTNEDLKEGIIIANPESDSKKMIPN